MEEAKPPMVVPDLPPVPVDPQVQEDFDTSRKAILDSLEISQGMLEELAVVAKQSQAPRAYEVAAKLVDSIRGLAGDLLDAHVKKDTLVQIAEPVAEPPKGLTQNNFYVGNTDDLLKIVKPHQVDEEDDLV